MIINKKEYKLKYTFRALMLFEQITNKMFSIDTLTDELIFFYSLILANNPDNTPTYDEFIDAIDNDNSLMQQFHKFLSEEAEKRNIYSKVEDGEKKSN